SSASSAPPPVVIANAKSVTTLITVGNGESYSSVYPNPASLDGSDPTTKYDVSYTFNSGVNLAFKLVDVQSSYECADGTQGHLSTTYALTGTGPAQSFDVDDVVALTPNTGYTLTIASTGDCAAKAHLNMNVLAYMGEADAGVVKPTHAEDCYGDGTTG